MDVDGARDGAASASLGLDNVVLPDDVARDCSSFGVDTVKEEYDFTGSKLTDEHSGNDWPFSAVDHSNHSCSELHEVEMVDSAVQSLQGSKDHSLDAERILTLQELPNVKQEVPTSKPSASQYKSLMSEFDEYVANDKYGVIESGLSRALSYGFQVGDLVWGKVRSHPWWPGHIFNEAFATPSVRRTGRAGYVLVAFFGDSSYGWFDPAELIPFEANFTEKSRQTNSRTFVKAVEEAVNEISRRSALCLACKCRNNFRPTSIRGYFEINVPDYEHGVYSETQIKKARDCFVPRETISFIRQLASVPLGSDQTTLNFFQNKAAAFAYRKAVFEESDETYAQAFGTPAKHTSQDTGATELPIREQSRVPLSGPLLIAEALCGSKSSGKPLKVKDQSKYLIMRRDDSAPPASGGDSDVSEGYVVQKRVPSASLDSQSSSKPEQDRSTVIATPGQDLMCNAAVMDGTPSRRNSYVVVGDAESAKHELQESQDIKSNIPGLDQRSGAPVNSSVTGIKQAISGVDGMFKKKKAVKRPPGELSSETNNTKKKKRKVLGPEQSSDHERNQMVAREVVGPFASRVLPKSDDGSNSILDSAGPLAHGGTGRVRLELTDLLAGLHLLAVEHFRGVESINRAVIKKSFLRFRSLVYQKSLIIPPASETDAMENRPAKVSAKAHKELSNDSDRKSLHPKPIKASPRADDLSRGGTKRAPSDRQDELEAKKLKRMSKLKSLASGKKANRKVQDMRPAEEKESVAAASLLKPARTVPTRRMEPLQPGPQKAAEPTMLVMKFPPETALPSVAHLKARFARFGPLDHNSIRVFWKSSTCRVVFQHKVDAQEAYIFAMGNNMPFGNVRCHVRPVDLPGHNVPELNEDSMTETPSRHSVATQPFLTLQQQSVQLKSCLKKPPGEESGPNSGNGGRGTARVKFLLGGEDNLGQDQPMIGNASSNNSTISGSYGAATSSTSTSSVGGTIYNSKNFQHESSSLPTFLPIPSQYAISQHKHHNNSSHHYLEIPMRNQLQPTNTVTAAAGMASADISQKMISLLTRCNDVVTSLTGVLGYVPYHPI